MIRTIELNKSADLNAQCEAVLHELERAYEPEGMQAIIENADAETIEEIRSALVRAGWDVDHVEIEEEGRDNRLYLKDENDTGKTAEIVWHIETQTYDIEYEDERGGLYDWLGNQLAIHEWRLDYNREYKSALIQCCWGGPNVNVDTGAREIRGYWGSDESVYYLSTDLCDALDELLEEIYNC